MATEIIYKDIDLSMERDIHNDIGILTNENAVRGAFYNNLMLSSNDIFFSNGRKLSAKGLLNLPSNFLGKIHVENVINSAINADPRIKQLNDVAISINGANWDIGVSMQINMQRDEKDEEVKMNFSVRRL